MLDVVSGAAAVARIAWQALRRMIDANWLNVMSVLDLNRLMHPSRRPSAVKCPSATMTVPDRSIKIAVDR